MAAAVIAAARASQDREEAVQRRREEAFREVMRRPLSVAWVDPQKVGQKIGVPPAAGGTPMVRI
jgi:hypothetical protein